MSIHPNLASSNRFSKLEETVSCAKGSEVNRMVETGIQKEEEREDRRSGGGRAIKEDEEEKAGRERRGGEGTQGSGEERSGGERRGREGREKGKVGDLSISSAMAVARKREIFLARFEIMKSLISDITKRRIRKWGGEEEVDCL